MARPAFRGEHVRGALQERESVGRRPAFTTEELRSGGLTERGCVGPQEGVPALGVSRTRGGGAGPRGRRLWRSRRGRDPERNRLHRPSRPAIRLTNGPATLPSVRPPDLRSSVLKTDVQTTPPPSAQISVPLSLCAEQRHVPPRTHVLPPLPAPPRPPIRFSDPLRLAMTVGCTLTTPGTDMVRNPKQ